MSILVVGGDSAEMFRQQTGCGHQYVEHWSGRKNRDMAKTGQTDHDPLDLAQWLSKTSGSKIDSVPTIIDHGSRTQRSSAS